MSENCSPATFVALQPPPTGRATDFDFLFGHWVVEHRRLQQRLVGCAEWDIFAGQASCRPLLGGLGNVDDNIVDLPSGRYRAISMRAFDPASRHWSVWWLDGRYPHSLDVPLVGGFEDGIGSFFAADTLNNMPIIARFRWTVAASPIWEQAFSLNGGESWVTNWTMRFTADPGPTLT